MNASIGDLISFAYEVQLKQIAGAPDWQEQVGLKLESKKTPVEVLVIDHVEKPSAN